MRKLHSLDYPVPMVTDVNIAYLAGLYEGEGNLHTFNSGKQIRLRIMMTDEDVVRSAISIISDIATYSTWQQSRNTGHAYKPIHCLYVGKRDNVTWLGKVMWPWLGQRRREQFIVQFDKLNVVSWGMLDNPFETMASCT